MTMPKIPRLPLVLVALSSAIALLPGIAQAAVSCSATASPVNFGTIDPQQPGNSPATGSISFTCQNDALLQTAFVTLCLNIGAGSGTGTTPRRMNDGVGHTLDFQLYSDPARSQIWGSVLTPATPNPQVLQFQIPGPFLFVPGSYSDSVPVYGQVPGNQTGVVAGGYNNMFSGTSAQITLDHNDAFLGIGGSYPASCGTGNASSFSFVANATVQPTCTVSATDVSFGSQPAMATNLQATGTIGVRCINGTAYNIGLAPSNGNAYGAGVMSGTGANTDTVPYQLHQTSSTGPVWGNTATATSVGNGVHGTGNGTTQPYTVHVVVPDANHIPDTYEDTVTVYVNY